MSGGEKGPWTMASDAVPAADQNHHWHSPLRPGHPNTCPAHPQPSGAIRRGGRTHSEFLPGATETVHTVPACRPGASWPLSLVEAVVGTCPFAHHGLPAKAPQRNREWPRRNRSRAPETGLRFRFRTVTLWARAPPPSRGWAGTRAHHPPLMGPGQEPAGCRGQSPHRQLCAQLTHPGCLSSPSGLLTCCDPPTLWWGLSPSRDSG